MDDHSGDRDRESARAEEALLLTQFAADHAPDAIYWIDENAQFVYVNQAACQSLDYSRDELLRMGVPDIDPTWPKDKWDSMWEDLKEKGSYTFETVHQTKQGRIFPVEIRANFIEYHGKSLDCAYARDISERKAAEETLRFTQYAVDNISDIATWITPDARFIYANKAATEILGYTRDELLDMTVFDINSRFNPENWSAHWDEVREKRVMTFEAPVRTKSGDLISAEVRVNFVVFEGKEYHYTFLRDTSERKCAETDRLAFERRLDEHKHKFYRETILSVTDGKLDICEPADLLPYIRDAQARIDVRQASDAAEARGQVAGFCHLLGLPDDEACAFVIGAGEAITNALKHGSGGRVYAGKSDNEVWVGVKDKGPGIESLILPRAVLRKGFSTKPSLGLGYSIMLDVADRILLRTSERGTTVVLIKSLHEETHTPFEALPDTWEGIPDLVG